MEGDTVMGKRRVLLVVVMALLTVVGFGALIGGGALVVVHATQRDSNGYYRAPTQHLQTATAVLMTRADLAQMPDHSLGTLRVDALSAAQHPLFIGIGPADAVEGWLAGTSYERINRCGSDPGSIPATTTTPPALDHTNQFV